MQKGTANLQLTCSGRAHEAASDGIVHNAECLIFLEYLGSIPRVEREERGVYLPDRGCKLYIEHGAPIRIGKFSEPNLNLHTRCFAANDALPRSTAFVGMLQMQGDRRPKACPSVNMSNRRS